MEECYICKAIKENGEYRLDSTEEPITVIVNKENNKYKITVTGAISVEKYSDFCPRCNKSAIEE